MRKLYRTHAILFVCAYGAFLGYRFLTEPSAARPSMNEPARPAVVAPSASITANTAVAATKRVSDEHAAGKKVTVVDATIVNDKAAETALRERLSSVALQATRAQQPQKRAEAIDQLNAATPESLQALQAVVTTDDAPRNRIRAINTLSVLAERDGAHDAVISILRLAMTDANPSVASRANEVYRQLTDESAPGG